MGSRDANVRNGYTVLEKCEYLREWSTMDVVALLDFKHDKNLLADVISERRNA